MKAESKTKDDAAKKSAIPASAIVTEPEKPAGTKTVTNKFAALNFDDSDED